MIIESTCFTFQSVNHVIDDFKEPCYAQYKAAHIFFTESKHKKQKPWNFFPDCIFPLSSRYCLFLPFSLLISW